MKIIKYKKEKNNKYLVFLDNNETITLHENVILDNELLIKKEINNIEKLLDENNKYIVMDDAINYIKHHLRSVYEVKKYLKEQKYSDDLIEIVITKLLENNYLNDLTYTKTYIEERINLSNDGPLKIRNYLLEKQIMDKVIDECLIIFNNELIDIRIVNYIEKSIKLNKKSSYALKNKVLMNLYNLGYPIEDIKRNLYLIDNIDDTENFIKDKEKLLKKLSKKYSGKELEYKLKEKLFQLGYRE